MTKALAIAGAGAFTPIGFTVEQNCAAWRAGLSAFKESSYFPAGTSLEPFTDAAVPSRASPQEDDIFERLVAMASAALFECVKSSGVTPQETVLYFCMRESYRSDPDLDGRNQELFDRVQAELGVTFHPRSAVIADGNAAVFRALHLARRRLVEKDAEACIVGGVDTFLTLPDFVRFENARRLCPKTCLKGSFQAKAPPLSLSDCLGKTEVVPPLDMSWASVWRKSEKR